MEAPAAAAAVEREAISSSSLENPGILDSLGATQRAADGHISSTGPPSDAADVVYPDSQSGVADSAAAGLPRLSLLLHDNPSCLLAAKGSRGATSGRSRSALHVDPQQLSLAAAVGGVMVLTGSLLSLAIARGRGGKRERRLKEGLQQKEAALASMRLELDALRAASSRLVALEAELSASRQHLHAMNQEVEGTRAASRKIESDMALFQDQLSSVSASEAEVQAALAAAEAKAAQAEGARQAAEAALKQAEGRWSTAKQELMAAQAEVDTLRGELGLRGSQLQGLTRELEFTRRQLANAEKRAEHAQMESRSHRSGFSHYEDWD